MCQSKEISHMRDDDEEVEEKKKRFEKKDERIYNSLH